MDKLLKNKTKDQLISMILGDYKEGKTPIKERLRECERIKDIYFDKIEFLTKKNNSLTVNSSKLKNYEYMESLISDYRLEISDLKDENERLLKLIKKINK